MIAFLGSSNVQLLLSQVGGNHKTTFCLPLNSFTFKGYLGATSVSYYLENAKVYKHSQYMHLSKFHNKAGDWRFFFVEAWKWKHFDFGPLRSLLTPKWAA